MTDSFGILYRLTDWGGTHDEYLEGLVEGCPQGIVLDMPFLEEEMQRRAPNSDRESTQRHEDDPVEFLSGLDAGNVTTGEPIRFRIPNHDVRIDERHRFVIKPSHASYTYYRKYGYRDNELCGRASARETACRVVAGAIAKMVLRRNGIEIHAETLRRGTPACEGDSVGAVVGCRILGAPAGLGEPLYDKFSARLAFAMMSINAAKGFEIGLGYQAAEMGGSRYNDVQNPDFSYRTNHDGGVQGGITNGQEVYFTVAFKPIPTVRFDQETIDYDGNPAIYHGSNRNDLCVAPRVLPIVEAMAAMVTLDFMLLRNNELEHNDPNNEK